MRFIVFSVAVATSGCAATPELTFAAGDASAPPPDAEMRDTAVEGASHDAVADAPTPIDAPVDARCALAGTTSVATCDACLEAGCCETANACFADAECVALLQCIRTCVAGGGQLGACRASCRNQHPSGVKAFDAVASCVASSCKSAACI